MQKIAVFGCGGFLASHIVGELDRRGYSLMLFSTSCRAMTVDATRLEVACYSPQTCPPSILSECDLVISFCTEGVSHKQQYGVKTISTNIELAYACASLCSGTRGRRLFHIGSTHERALQAHAETLTKAIDSSLHGQLEGLGTYSVSKIAQTLTLSAVASELEIMTTILLAPNVYGPPNPINSLAGHLDRVHEGLEQLTLKNPERLIDVLHINDFSNKLIEAVEQCLHQSFNAGTFLISCGGTLTTVKEFSEMYLNDRAGRRHAKIGRLL